MISEFVPEVLDAIYSILD